MVRIGCAAFEACKSVQRDCADLQQGGLEDDLGTECSAQLDLPVSIDGVDEHVVEESA